MTWETITTQLGGKSSGVTMAWRVPGGRQSPALALSIGADLVSRLGLTRGTGPQDKSRVVVQRNVDTEKLRVRIATADEPRHMTRSAAWKDGGVCITIPLDDLRVFEKKAAVQVDYAWTEGERFLEAMMPDWARKPRPQRPSGPVAVDPQPPAPKLHPTSAKALTSTRARDADPSDPTRLKDAGDVAEARTLQRKGKSAQFIAAEFGWTVSEAIAICAALRDLDAMETMQKGRAA